MLKSTSYGLHVLYLCVFVVLSTACGPVTAQPITAVTPLPDGALTPSPTATAVVDEDTGAQDGPITSPEADEESGLEEVTASGNSSEAVPTATPKPLSNNLPPGEAAAIALAADLEMKPDIENPIVFDEFPVPITFEEFYNGFSIRHGLVLSDKLQSLDSQQVVMEGYMAPPLKPEIDWFVLTSVRLEFCPFCSSAADWPDDIALVYLMDYQNMMVTTNPMRVTGQLELGPSVDPETGMVSIVRIYAEEVEEIIP